MQKYYTKTGTVEMTDEERNAVVFGFINKQSPEVQTAIREFCELIDDNTSSELGWDEIQLVLSHFRD